MLTALCAEVHDEVCDPGEIDEAYEGQGEDADEIDMFAGLAICSEPLISGDFAISRLVIVLLLRMSRSVSVGF